MDWIESQAAQYTDLAADYANLGELARRKLWHQLTDALDEFVNKPEANRGDNLLQLYDRFVSTFEQRLNQLRFVRILAQICTQYYPSRPFVVPELDRAIHLFDGLKEKRGRLGDEAYVVCVTERLSLLVKKACAAGVDPAEREALLTSVRVDLDECQTELDAIVDADPVASATFYRVRAEYHKVKGPAAEFYRNALQFLAYSAAATSLPHDEQKSLAIDIALAALVGDKVFNFGEIVAHPVMETLAGTPHEWLTHMLRAFHTGDIDEFNSIVAANRAAYDSQPALSAADQTVKEKVAIVCVMELASKRPATDRSISFADIAAATRLPIDNVEWLLMRAMSFGLIRGVIDEVDQVVHVSFIKPRVMDMTQIVELQARMAAWSEKVKSTLLYIEDRTRELFA